MSCCSYNNTVTAPAVCNHDLTDHCSTVYYTAEHCQDHITPLQSCNSHCDCTPIPETPVCAREYRLCIDQNGCATRYPADCRSRFWPAFSHPRWLPCNALYCTGKGCRCRKGC